MNIWLLLSGDYAAPHVMPKCGDVVIAVDGGMRHANALKVTPSLWIGDFDSASSALMKAYQHVKRQTFPKRKDDTDLALALKYVQETFTNLDTVHLIGAFGDEFDHVFANFWLLPTFQLATIAWGKRNHAIYLPAHQSLSLQGGQSQVVSVFALTVLHGVTYQGLEWPLHKATIDPFTTISARNIMAENHASITWQRGDGLVIVGQDITPRIG